MASVWNSGGGTSAWTLCEQVLRDLRDISRSAAAAYDVLGTNAKTGQKLLTCGVRHDVAKVSALKLLEFFAKVRSGGAINFARFHESDLRRVAEEYGPERTWSELIEELPGKPPETVRAVA